MKDGESWRTTPFAIAQGISQGLAENTVVAKVNGDVWDLDRPLEGDCKLELLKFDNAEAKAVSGMRVQGKGARDKCVVNRLVKPL